MAVALLHYLSAKRHNNTVAPLGVSAEAFQHPQWVEVFMNGRKVEECVCMCVCMCACRKRSAGLLCFSSPPRLSSSLPTPRRRAMNHNHARARFELERPAQPPARQMHLMTGGAPVSATRRSDVSSTSGQRPVHQCQQSHRVRSGALIGCLAKRSK